MLGGEGAARIAFHSGEPLTDPHLVQLHFQVEDVDETYRELRSEGVVFDRDPHDTEWGYRMARLTDPPGHTVELYTESAAGDEGGSAG